MRISDWSSDVCSSDLAFHVGSLLFDLINAAFPDAASTRGYFGSSMRWSTASVIIAFPVFALLARHLARETERQPIKRLSPVRRWLTYLTLFLAAVALICDVTTLVYNLLGGELSVRFRSEEHTSELQSLMRISYAVFCL